MKRLYDSIIKEHLSNEKQMIFISGPRQVGKTTLAQAADKSALYFNWDRQQDRKLIIAGVDAIAAKAELDTIHSKKKVLIFDEIHKYPKWKNFLKGFYDAYHEKCLIIVTGSARLNVFKRGGDSLMGRYFLYRVHPLSIAELKRTRLIEKEIQAPVKCPEVCIKTLLDHGGFPEPYMKADKRFYNRWMRLRTEQLFREDLRDLTLIQDIGQVQVMADLISSQAGQILNYSTFAKQLNVSVETIKRWTTALESIFYCYTIKPWSKNIPKALRKQPKIYLVDWSIADDPGAKYENFVASHLLKAVQWWTDIGLGKYELFFIRDKTKREVDFLVVKDQTPWFLVEVKSSKSADMSKSLKHFHNLLETKHAFQVVFDLPFVQQNCFEEKNPIKVPASTFLSQLI